MNKLSLLVAAALVACGTLAQAEPTSPNPFARPQAGSPAPGASATGAAGPATPSATAPGVHPMPMTPQGTPAPGTPPSMQPGFTPGPGMSAPPAVNSMPLPPGVFPPPAGVPGADTTEEEVTAQRVGTINGEHLYRGQNTYMFESSKTRKIVRKLVPSTTPVMPTPALPPANAAQPATKAPNLPSMVGRPTPTK